MSASSNNSSRRVFSYIAKAFNLLNYDFCPWANRYVYWLKQPIGWLLVGAAAAALTAYFLAPHAWIIFGSLAVVIVLGVAWPWIAIRGVSAEIHFESRRASAGESVQVRLQVSNRLPWPLWGLTVEKGFFVSEEETALPVVALAQIPGWSKSEFLFEFRPDRRGVYPHVVPELATGFPFGIWRAHRTINVARDILVWPQTTRLNSIPSLGGDIADVVGILFDRPGNEGDTIGVRPFRHGDRLRSIHWAQTARRDTFIVSERQAAVRRPVDVAVDLEAFAPMSNGDDELREAAISVGASLAQGFHSHRAQVRFTIGELEQTLELGSVGLRRLLDSLARFEADEHTLTRPRFSRETLVVVVTTSERQSAWAGEGEQVRFVLLDADTSGSTTTNSSRSRVWIRLSEADRNQQLRRQWERVCHDSVAN